MKFREVMSKPVTKATLMLSVISMTVGFSVFTVVFLETGWPVVSLFSFVIATAASMLFFMWSTFKG